MRVAPAAPDLGLFEKQAERFSVIPLIGKQPFEDVSGAVKMS